MSSVCPQDVLNGSAGNLICDAVRIARITAWTLTATSGETVFADSDSGGFTNRIPARRELTGSADFTFDVNFPQPTRLVEGECCHLVLFLSAAVYWDIPVALITSVTINVNVEDLEVIDGSVEFGSSGAYFRPGEAGAHAHVLPAAPT